MGALLNGLECTITVYICQGRFGTVGTGPWSELGWGVTGVGARGLGGRLGLAGNLWRRGIRGFFCMGGRRKRLLRGRGGWLGLGGGKRGGRLGRRIRRLRRDGSGVRFLRGALRWNRTGRSRP